MQEIPRESPSQKGNANPHLFLSTLRGQASSHLGPAPTWGPSGHTHRMYMMTPKDHISQDLSYFSGPSTSGAANQRSVWMGLALGHADLPRFSVDDAPSPDHQPVMTGLQLGEGGEQP